MSKKADSAKNTTKEQPKEKKQDNRFAAEIERLQKELEEANQKAEANWDKALRACAELENAQRRQSIDLENAHKFALEKFCHALLPVIDSMEKALAIDSDHEEVKAMCQGIELTEKMFIDHVAKFGLVQINPEGEVFDPELHEAMSMMPSPEVDSNTVITVYQKGYQLNGRLIRPARVVVSQ